jgi:hypothetical protein
MSGTKFSRRFFRLFLRSVLCLTCISSYHLTAAEPGSGGWFNKLFRPSPKRSFVATNPGLADYIRRLSNEARVAALRGDLETAHALAERAYKVSLSAESTLANHPDCSPAAIQALLDQFQTAPKLDESSTVSTPLPAPVDVTASPAAPPQDVVPLMIPPSPLPPDAQPSNTGFSSPVLPKDVSPPPLAHRSDAVDPLTKMQARRKTIPNVVEPPATKPAELPPSLIAKDGKERVHADGFLVLKKDWLSSDAGTNDAIEALTRRSPQPPLPADRPETRTTLSAPPLDESRHSKTDVFADSREVDESRSWNSKDPHVTTASGQAKRNRRPGVFPTNADRERNSSGWNEPSSLPAAASPLLSRDDLVDETTVPLWPAASPDPKAPPDAAATDFPESPIVAAAPLSHHANAVAAPQPIETDFRTAAAVPISRPEETRARVAPSRNPASMCVTESNSPAVTIRSADAFDWSSPCVSGESTPQKSRTDVPWKPLHITLTPENQVLVIGTAMLVGGLALFGLSFRRT